VRNEEVKCVRKVALNLGYGSGLYRRLWTSLPTPVVSAQRPSERSVLLRIKEQRNILHEISKRKANCIGHILRRNCLLRQVIEGKIKGGIEVIGRRGRRHRKLLDDVKGKERILTSEGGSSISHCVDSSLWTCRETDC
jgi:hypothetical protein